MGLFEIFSILFEGCKNFDWSQSWVSNFSCWNNYDSVFQFTGRSRAWELNYGFACDVSLGHKPVCWDGKLSLSVTWPINRD